MVEREISTRDKSWIPEVHQYIRNKWKKGAHQSVKRRNNQRIKREIRREYYDRYQGSRHFQKKKLSAVSKA